MRNFFEQQAAAQRRTSVLLVCMALAVVAMGSTVFGFVWLVRQGLVMLALPVRASWQLGPLFLWCVSITAALVSAASLARIVSLHAGGASVAEMLDARLVSGQPRDDLDRRLLNIVAEMALAAGTPVPQVFVLDNEHGINALAAGWELGDAMICATHGCLEKLTRAELQGVVAHEFSHILHGDTRLNLRLMGTVFGMLSVGLLGKQLMGVRDANGKAGALALLGSLLAAVGAVGGVLGKLVKAAVSRQREFLADASAVQFTRHPEGIASALKKIGGYGYGSRIYSARAEEASHFFFSEISVPESWALFSTHPTLTARIRRLEPGFGGGFTAPAPGLAEPPQAEPFNEPAKKPARAERISASAAFIKSLAAPVPANSNASPQLTASELAGSVGSARATSLATSQAWLEQLDPELAKACDNGLSACALVFAMLVHPTPALAQRQLLSIRELAGRRLLAETERLYPLIASASRPDRLTLATLAAPALRSLSKLQLHMLRQTAAALIADDGATSLFEHVLGHILTEHWSRSSERRPPRRQSALSAHLPEVRLILSALAHTGAAFDDSAAQAFSAALARLPGISLQLAPPSTRLLSGLGPALDGLQSLRPVARTALLDACTHAVLADRRVTEDELTLLRAVCLALEAPLPRLG